MREREREKEESVRDEGGGFEGEESLMIYRGFGFITANSPSPQTPNSLSGEKRAEAEPCHAPDFSSFTRLIPRRWYVRAAVSASKEPATNL